VSVNFKYNSLAGGSSSNFANGEITARIRLNGSTEAQSVVPYTKNSNTSTTFKSHSSMHDIFEFGPGDTISTTLRNDGASGQSTNVLSTQSRSTELEIHVLKCWE
jgi:hypothetical protein